MPLALHEGLVQNMNVQYVQQFQDTFSYKVQICRLIKWCFDIVPPASLEVLQ
jgi:hypothetical protein